MNEAISGTQVEEAQEVRDEKAEHVGAAVSAPVPFSSGRDWITESEFVTVLRNEKGRGCYARVDLVKDQLIESCPVIAMAHLRQDGHDVLQHYVWRWRTGNAIALGLCGSLVNHATVLSGSCNVASDYDYDKGCITFKAFKDIPRGTELIVCYDMGYPDPVSNGNISAMLGEMNTAVVAEYTKRNKDQVDRLHETIERHVAQSDQLRRKLEKIRSAAEDISVKAKDRRAAFSKDVLAILDEQGGDPCVMSVNKRTKI